MNGLKRVVSTLTSKTVSQLPERISGRNETRFFNPSMVCCRFVIPRLNRGMTGYFYQMATRPNSQNRYKVSASRFSFTFKTIVTTFGAYLFFCSLTEEEKSHKLEPNIDTKKTEINKKHSRCNAELNESGAANMKNKIYDLTETIGTETIVYPGDPKFSVEEIMSIKKGDNFNLCHFHLGNHTGTHIDFPSHIIENGKTSSDYDIENFIGEGLVIHIPDSENIITKELIINSSNCIKKNDIIFFKTSNSNSGIKRYFSEKYVHLDINAAKYLVDIGVKIVGIDYLSVDNYHDDKLPVHNTFLKNGVLIVENLRLSQINAGRYKFHILPLKVGNMDGLPTRIIATSISEVEL